MALPAPAAAFPSQAEAIIDEHWTRERIALVVIGLVSFYVTYVSYRNLKNFLPRVNHDDARPRAAPASTSALMFGHEPAVVLHAVLGRDVAAHVLATVYLLFLPVSPVSLIVCLVWSRNISYGYWYATAQCLAWVFGTVSYYLLPTLGPNFAFPSGSTATWTRPRSPRCSSRCTTPASSVSHPAQQRLHPERRRLRLAARRRSS